MNRYAVGVCEFGEKVEVLIVEAKSEIEAMKIALLENVNWEIETDPEFHLIETAEDLQNLASKGEVNISIPVSI